MEAPDPAIYRVIELSVAASRLRVAATFEPEATSRRFQRLADERSALAGALLNGMHARAETAPGAPTTDARGGAVRGR
jgi:hypothetical protein